MFRSCGGSPVRCFLSPCATARGGVTPTPRSRDRAAQPATWMAARLRRQAPSFPNNFTRISLTRRCSTASGDGSNRILLSYRRVTLTSSARSSGYVTWDSPAPVICRSPTTCLTPDVTRPSGCPATPLGPAPAGADTSPDGRRRRRRRRRYRTQRWRWRQTPGLPTAASAPGCRSPARRRNPEPVDGRRRGRGRADRVAR